MYLHGVVGVLVVEDERLLDELVVSLQLVNVRFVVDDVLLIIFQVVHLFLQRAGNVNRHMANLLNTHTHMQNNTKAHFLSSFFYSANSPDYANFGHLQGSHARHFSLFRKSMKT